MKKLVIALSLFLQIGCTSYSGHFFIHSDSMKESIESEHIQYKEGHLVIDEEKIELPEGKTLKINYKSVNGVVSYTVKVDGNIVKAVRSSTKE